MKEIEFREWLNKKNISTKVQSDYISRIKRMERILDSLDIDVEYEYDKFSRLKTFISEGCESSPYKKNLELKSTRSKYALKCALNKYISFIQDSSKN